jgi:aerobic C4-dicarboxylate transport protein
LTSPATRKSFFTTLYFRVIVGIVAGVLVGWLYPQFGASLKPINDGFLKLIKMLVTPIIFLTVVSGIASAGDLRRLGRVGLKAITYFEVVSTFALVLGMIAATVMQPGRGMNATPTSLDAKAVSQYTTAAHQTTADFLLNIIPDSFLGAFTRGEILQVLLLAILTGIALVVMRDNKPLTSLVHSLSELFFKIIGVVMQVAPLGAFGAMAFTVGRYGSASLISLGKLVLCSCVTSVFFIALVLGAICWACGINLWRLVVYLREELLLVLGTSSSETALPGLMVKMERLGCSKDITGLVIPAGYSFNLDGTSVYLTVATLFLAQATNTHLSLREQIFILFVLMLNSKGSATVTGGGLITLAATLGAIGTVPVASVALLLGVDRFLSEVRAITNILGNSVATIVVARWEGQFDHVRAHHILHNHAPIAELELTMQENTETV